MTNVAAPPESVEPSIERVQLDVSGMHCASCVARVESALTEAEGVRRVSVNLAEGSATVEGASLDADRMIDAVRRRGFDASLARRRASVAEQRTSLERKRRRSARAWGRRAVAGLLIWIPLEILHWFGEALGFGSMHAAMSPALWIAAALGVVSWIYVGGAFYRSAWKAARGLGVNMDTLVAIGATAAFGFSFAVFILTLRGVEHHLPLYFGEASALLAIIAVGHWLEAKTSAAAGSAIRELLALQPDDVTRLRSARDTTGEIVPSAEIESGDFMLIRAGERVAVDGEIEDGASTLDEAVVTGEPMPVMRRAGDAVVAGSMNLTGRLVVRATTSGRDTTVARIAEMVREAQSSKANIQRIADRVVSIFVPAVLLIAGLSFVGWGLFGGESQYFPGYSSWIDGLINATTALVISCPCALGLATPTAVMVGSGHASRRGILVKSAPTLERAASVDTVMFDKTGTLTLGRPVVIRGEDDALRLAAALAHGSSHPLSVAIMNEAARRGIELPPSAMEIEEQPGRGMSGVIENGARVELISRAAAETGGGAHQLPSEAAEEHGATESVVIVDGRETGRIAFRDEPRPEAREVIARLRSMGQSVRLLTGDRQEVALEIGRHVGLEPNEIEASLKPEDKVNALRRAIDEGRTVAMVGDGINDAAALALAGASGGAGIAIGAGTNIAIESADVVIPADRLHAIPELIELSERTLRTIKQNLFLSFIYNTLAIPAAALGFLGVHGPMIAAVAMGLSDFCVVGNSLRLKWRLGRSAG